MAAPSISIGELAVHLRLSTHPNATIGEPVNGILTRLMAAAADVIAEYDHAAPVAVVDVAVIDFCKYVYDRPHFTRQPALAFQNSGAMALLSPWHNMVGVKI